MGSVDSLQKVAEIVEREFFKKTKFAVVCSAMSGTTDELFEIADFASNGDKKRAFEVFKKIKKRHFSVAKSFGVAETFNFSIEPIFEDLENLIRGLLLIHEVSSRSRACLAAFGEKLSTRLLAEILKTRALPAVQLDSDFVRTVNGNFENSEVDWVATRKFTLRALAFPLENGQIPVATGFFGRNEAGILTLLGRGGSDFSATILAKSLGWKTVEIWTDVDGFLSADPRIVKNPKLIRDIGFLESSELCFFGAKILHPKTIRPVIEAGGEVFIRNTFFPENPGTRIAQKVPADCHPFVSITTKKVGLFSVDIFGAKFRKSTVFSEIFTTADKLGVSIDAIAASEATISFCVEEKFLKNEKFTAAIQKIAPTEIQTDRTIICLVSPEQVRGRAGVAAELFDALRDAKISVELYSQNASELAQLVVVKTPDAVVAVRAIHDRVICGKCFLTNKFAIKNE